MKIRDHLWTKNASIYFSDRIMFKEQKSQPSTCNPAKAPPTTAFVASSHVIHMSWNINIPHSETTETLLGLDHLQICFLSVLNYLLVL